ncbi:hypothetical protein E2C01_047929 [Portunus trituberculatus]|uniref:Uncharacterized protein n=1 Tax=Portunus trituberculatus TaxID=210409 RepID=A0A5B7G4X2_PORTR|nr:hypothetical protein [Portunus trituberculatus]
MTSDGHYWLLHIKLHRRSPVDHRSLALYANRPRATSSEHRPIPHHHMPAQLGLLNFTSPQVLAQRLSANVVYSSKDTRVIRRLVAEQSWLLALHQHQPPHAPPRQHVTSFHHAQNSLVFQGVGGANIAQESGSG